MLIKGQEVSNIKLGNTLSNDHLYASKFDYMLSNPPFGVDWKKIEGDIADDDDEGAVGVALGELSGGETFGWRGRCVRGSGGAQRQEERGETKAKKNGAHGGLALWRRTGLFLTNVIEKSERGEARC
jgi:hypothetical protein